MHTTTRSRLGNETGCRYTLHRIHRCGGGGGGWCQRGGRRSRNRGRSRTTHRRRMVRNTPPVQESCWPHVRQARVHTLARVTRCRGSRRHYTTTRRREMSNQRPAKVVSQIPFCHSDPPCVRVERRNVGVPRGAWMGMGSEICSPSASNNSPGSACIDTTIPAHHHINTTHE